MPAIQLAAFFNFGKPGPQGPRLPPTPNFNKDKYE